MYSFVYKKYSNVQSPQEVPRLIRASSRVTSTTGWEVFLAGVARPPPGDGRPTLKAEGGHADLPAS